MRDLKDAMSRDILRDLEAAGIGIASATIEIVGLPPLRVEPPDPPRRDGASGAVVPPPAAQQRPPTG